MGTGGSHSYYTIEVSIEKPLSPCTPGKHFFARLHSAAEGSVRLKDWNTPQQVKLWMDDILTISLHTAKSEVHFDSNRCEDFVDVYLPVEVLKAELSDNLKVCFTMGLADNLPRLDQGAVPAQYLNAFQQSYTKAKDVPGGPHVKVWARAVDKTTETDNPIAALGTATATNPATVEALNSDDLQLLRQMQAQNQRLRGQLGIGQDDEIPEVRERMHLHMEQLQKAIFQNHALKEDLRRAEEELALTNQNLSESEISPQPTPPQSSDLPQVQDEAEFKQKANHLMEQIRNVTNANIQLIHQYDEQIKAKEAELSNAKLRQEEMRMVAPKGSEERNRLSALQRQQADLELIRAQCQKLQAAISQEMAVKQEYDSKLIQQLQLEKGVFLEEIEKLKHGLHQPTEEEEMTLPATAVLESQAEQLRAQLAEERRRGAQEKASMEKQSEYLRKQTQEYQQELSKILEEKKGIEQQQQELMQSRSAASALEREHEDLSRQIHTLSSAVSRSRRMIGVHDERIRELEQEKEDIRQRAQLIARTPPPTEHTLPTTATLSGQSQSPPTAETLSGTTNGNENLN